MKINTDKVTGLNLGLMKSKKGFMPIIGTAIMIIGVVVVAVLALKGLGINVMGGATNQLNIQETNRGTQERIDQYNSQVGGNLPPVPSTGLTNFNFIASNPLDDSGTTDWNAVTVKVKDRAGGAVQTYTTDTDGTFASSSMSLTYGKVYDAYVIVAQNTTVSAGPFEIDTKKYGAAGDLLIDVPDFDHVRFKAYDNKNKGYVWCNGDLSAAGATNDLIAARTCYGTTNSTAYAIANSDDLDFTFTVDVAAYKQFGDVKNYIAVDADASDYESVAMTFDGVGLKEVPKSVLNSNDQGYLSAYEMLFEQPNHIVAADKDLRLRLESKSTGTVDADVKVRFLSEVYRVGEDGKNVEKAIFNSAGTELLVYPGQEITLDLS